MGSRLATPAASCQYSLHSQSLRERRGVDVRTVKMELDAILGWTEFCAWAALLMTSVIWWLQGPPVSTDQFVIRTALVAIAAAAGIGLGIRASFRRRRSSASETPANESSPHTEPMDT
jgi:hypothetical protein